MEEKPLFLIQWILILLNVSKPEKRIDFCPNNNLNVQHIFCVYGS